MSLFGHNRQKRGEGQKKYGYKQTMKKTKTKGQAAMCYILHLESKG